MLSKSFFFGFLNSLIILIIGSGFLPSNQELNRWSPQQQIPGYQDDTLPPILIPDQNQTIHALTSQWVGGGNRRLAIIYNRWTLDQGWTMPVDILLSPLKDQARLLGAFLDQTGMMHVIFFGGDNTLANIYYSKAPVESAGKASAWSTPVLIGENALDPENGAIIGDEKGNLVVLFSSIRNGNGLSEVYSTDSGNTWSEPESIFKTGDNTLSPFDSKIYASPSGQLHTVWSVYNKVGHGVAVYYATLGIGQRKWSDPHVLAVGSDLGVSLPNITEQDGTLVVTYYNSNANAQWITRSSDDGQTWTEPVRISPILIGRNGAVSLTTDSKNVLHLFFGERRPGKIDIHGMWHTTFVNGQLTPVEAIVSGPRVNDISGNKGFDPYGARAAVSQGNVLLVTWQTDPGDIKPNGVWYSYSVLDAPELPGLKLPTETPTPSKIPTATTISPASIIPAQTSPILVDQDLIESSNLPRAKGINTVLAIGLIPVVLLLSIVLVWYFYSYYNNR